MRKRDIKYRIDKDTNLVKRHESNHWVFYDVNPNFQYAKDATVIISINGSRAEHYNESTHNSIFIVDNNSVFGHNGDTYDKDHRRVIAKWKAPYNSTTASQLGMLLALRCAHLFPCNRVVIDGKSMGGLIGLYASIEPNIDHVYGNHVPVEGSPFADFGEMKKVNTPVALASYILNPPKYAFNQDLKNGVTDLDKINLDKITLNSGTISEELTIIQGEQLKYRRLLEIFKQAKANNHDALMTVGAALIKSITGEESDGMVIYNRDRLISKGFNCAPDTHGSHSMTSNGDYNDKHIFELIKRDGR